LYQAKNGALEDHKPSDPSTRLADSTHASSSFSADSKGLSIHSDSPLTFCKKKTPPINPETTELNKNTLQSSGEAARKHFVLGVDHIAIAVEDLEEAIRWYCECLGFTLLARRTTQGERTGMHSAVLSRASAVIVLIRGTSPSSQVSQFIESFGVGVQHLALAVSDLDLAIKRIEEGGGAVDVGVIEDMGIRQAFLRRDQGSGVRIELIERSGGDFSDRSVEQLFREFEKRDLV
jgi:methylmalonyl-CoA/ethylmalonyl-CoA epimerase